MHLNQDIWRFVKGQQSMDVRVNGPLVCNDVTTLVQATINGTGIARIPYDIARHVIDNCQLIPILQDYTHASSQLWAVYLSRSYQQPVVRAFIDFVAERWQHDILPPIES